MPLPTDSQPLSKEERLFFYRSGVSPSIVEDAELRAILHLFLQHELRFKRGKEGVPLHFTRDEGKVEIRAERQSLLINLSSAANEKAAPLKLKV
jgi:hypothetical protein